MPRNWISVEEAAEMVGYSAAYFRREYCDPDQPVLTIRVRVAKDGRRFVRVNLASVTALLRRLTRDP